MFTIHLIKVVWEFWVRAWVCLGEEIKCCWVAKSLGKLLYETGRSQSYERNLVLNNNNNKSYFLFVHNSTLN